MNDIFRNLNEATRLTKEGRLHEAGETLQRAFGNAATAAGDMADAALYNAKDQIDFTDNAFLYRAYTALGRKLPYDAVKDFTPLSIVVGRVDATDVEVRGQPFSLVSVAKDNVARFEVK